MTAPRLAKRIPPLAAALLAGVLGGAPIASRACGACVEDKIAATYDHHVIERAAAAGDVVVYCEVEGPLARQRLLRAARRVEGIRAQSVRTSVQPATLSFAVDPKLRSPASAVAAAQRDLPAGTRLTIVHLVQPLPRVR